MDPAGPPSCPTVPKLESSFYVQLHSDLETLARYLIPKTLREKLAHRFLHITDSHTGWEGALLTYFIVLPYGKSPTVVAFSEQRHKQELDRNGITICIIYS